MMNSVDQVTLSSSIQKNGRMLALLAVVLAAVLLAIGAFASGRQIGPVARLNTGATASSAATIRYFKESTTGYMAALPAYTVNPELKSLVYPTSGVAIGQQAANPELKLMGYAPVGTAGTVFYAASELKTLDAALGHSRTADFHSNPELNVLAYSPTN